LKTVTGLRRLRPGRVLVELDGTDWRVLPDEAVLGGGLRLGLELDRPRLRELARLLRRDRALAVADRALRRRDLSEERLAERLRRSGAAPAATGEAVTALRRAGLLDDERFALGRARSLADRHWGDAAVSHQLEAEGVGRELVGHAVGSLEAESERARRVVAARGGGPRTARYLAARGFNAESIEAAGVGIAPGP
jgi:SOS response regulatory protein OraA/RecX